MFGNVLGVPTAGGAILVSGDIEVTNFPPMLPITGTVMVSNLPSTQAVVQADAQQPTYSASILESTIATPVYVSNFFSITGSPTKVVRIRKVGFSGLETSMGQKTLALYYLTGITGGTPVTVTPVSHDTNDPPATALCSVYATGTTPSGSTQTLVRTWTLYIPSVGSSAESNIEAIFGEGPQKPFTLRGTAQSLVLTFIGAPGSGQTINAYIDWTEENI